MFSVSQIIKQQTITNYSVILRLLPNSFVTVGIIHSANAYESTAELPKLTSS